LAATGDVHFLREQPDERPDVLLNRNFPLGGVELRLRSDDGEARSGWFELGKGRLNGHPALDDAERVHFLERCFLPQTALGRLLETYTASGKQVDTALVRFVKAVVGLDDLDSVIDGLYAAGHRARTRALSSGWQTADAELSAEKRAREEISEKLAEAEAALREELHALRSLADDSVANVADQDLLEAVSGRQSEHDTHETLLKSLEGARMRLEGVAAALDADSKTRLAPTDPAADVDAAVRTAAAFNQWEAGDGARALAQLNVIRDSGLALPPVALAQIFEGYQDAKSRALDETRRRTLEQQRSEERARVRSRLSARLGALQAEIEEAESAARAIAVPHDVRVLVEILEKTIPLATAEVCPVCDQHFGFEGQTLRQHLERKVQTLTSGADELVRAGDRLRRLRAEAEAVRVELEQIPVVSAPEDGKNLGALIRELNALESAITSGLSLYREVQRIEARAADIAARQASVEVAKRRLEAVRADLGIHESELEVHEEIERLRTVVEERIQAVTFEQTRRAREVNAARAAEELLRGVERLRADLQSVRRRESALTAAIKEASARKEAANALRMKTERVRSSVINQVFDQNLNALWADLFGRLAPAEPFVPRFRKQSEALRSVDIRLETVLPNGGVSGPPSSILSYGNTNTAALSLFVALHLAAPSSIPWLIFDDPVQSMDDIHISNFATLVRQLAYTHRRQIVIAVHQRELFEYLSLELAPGSEHESLLKVGLDRHGQSTVIHTERVEFVPEPALAQA
jgi:exonuclease SbcC